MSPFMSPIPKTEYEKAARDPYNWGHEILGRVSGHGNPVVAVSALVVPAHDVRHPLRRLPCLFGLDRILLWMVLIYCFSMSSAFRMEHIREHEHVCAALIRLL